VNLSDRYPRVTPVTRHDAWAIAAVGVLMAIGCVLPWFRVQGAARAATVGAPGAARIAFGLTLVAVAGTVVLAARRQQATLAVRSFVAAVGMGWFGTIIGCIALAELIRAVIDPDWLPTSLRRLFFGATPAWGVAPIVLAAAVMVVLGTYGGAAGGKVVGRTVVGLRRGDRTVWARSTAAASLLVLAWARYQPWERLTYGSRALTLSVWAVPWVGPFFSILLLAGVAALIGTLTPLHRPSTIVLIVVGWLVSLYGAIFIFIGVVPDLHVTGEVARRLLQWERQVSAYTGTHVSVIEDEARVGVGAAFGAVVAFTSGCLLMVSALTGLTKVRMRRVAP